MLRTQNPTRIFFTARHCKRVRFTPFLIGRRPHSAAHFVGHFSADDSFFTSDGNFYSGRAAGRSFGAEDSYFSGSIIGIGEVLDRPFEAGYTWGRLINAGPLDGLWMIDDSRRVAGIVPHFASPATMREEIAWVPKREISRLGCPSSLRSSQ